MEPVTSNARRHLMPSNLPPSDSTLNHGFRADQYRQKARLRDYAIYGVVLVILAGLVGAPLYYFSRPAAERNRLREKFGLTPGPLAGGADKAAAQSSGSAAEKPAATPAPSHPEPTPVASNVSVYGGSTQSVILPSANPKTPPASAEFTQFVTALKVSGAVQGNPARAILNGKSFRAGESIDATLGVIFAGLGVTDGRKFILLRDATGAELRLTY